MMTSCSCNAFCTSTLARILPLSLTRAGQKGSHDRQGLQAAADRQRPDSKSLAVHSKRLDMKKAQEILADMLESVPELKLAILLDIDGIPLAKAGESNLHPDDLGAMLAAASRSYIVLGEDMGQGSFDQITVNYRDTKLLQFGMPRSSLALVAAADASMSIIKLEAKRAVVQLEELMDVTVDEREVMMKGYQLARPTEDADEIQE